MITKYKMFEKHITNEKLPETIGKIFDDGTFELEYSGQGEIYKNYYAYYNEPKKICYLPESSETLDDGYTSNDFLKLAIDFLKENNYKGKPRSLANNLFEHVDWQSPETLLNEWEDSMEFEEYPESHDIKENIINSSLFFEDDNNGGTI